MEGRFITIEGCDGSGKSTQIQLLKRYFDCNKIPVFFTREPGGTDISEQIRRIILNQTNVGMDTVTELLLYAASRRQLTLNVIKKYLESGVTVFCDRYIDSTVAYQGYGRGIDIELIKMLNELATDRINISLTIFMDLDPLRAFERKGGADTSDRLENEASDFYKRVYSGYQRLAAEEPQRIVSVNADRDSEAIHSDIITILKEKRLI